MFIHVIQVHTTIQYIILPWKMYIGSSLTRSETRPNKYMYIRDVEPLNIEYMYIHTCMVCCEIQIFVKVILQMKKNKIISQHKCERWPK